MCIVEDFQIAGGSVLGRNHRQSGKNNQDFYCWNKTDDFFVGIVADGCGSHPHSEVGAKIGSRILMEQLSFGLKCYGGRLTSHMDHVGDGQNPFWEKIRQNTLAYLRVVVNSMGGSFHQTVLDYFLFSFVGVIVGPDIVTIFSCGDGMYALNGEVRVIEPLEGNKPIYLAYGLLHPDNLLGPLQGQPLHIQVQEFNLTPHTKNFLIGTDGVEYFMKSEGKPIGNDHVVEPLSHFWTEDRYFKNRDRIRRTLFLANRKGEQYGRPVEGYLADDTTIIVGRKTFS